MQHYVVEQAMTMHATQIHFSGQTALKHCACMKAVAICFSECHLVEATGFETHGQIKLEPTALQYCINTVCIASLNLFASMHAHCSRTFEGRGVCPWPASMLQQMCQRQGFEHTWNVMKAVAWT